MNDLSQLPRLTLTERQRFDLEQLLSGGFAPLRGFLNEVDYDSVVERMRLADGSVWPMPITLDVSQEHGRAIGDKLVLCDLYGNPIAYFTVESIYRPVKEREAKKVFGTTDLSHPGVRHLTEEAGPVYLGGPVELIAYAPVHDFKELRYRPDELKQELKRRGWDKVVAFQTRNPIHRAHFELIRRAAESVGAKALVHPTVGLTKEGDIDYVTRVRAYKRLVDARMQDFAMLSLLPIAMRMGGPREALWHALIRKNYGATHFIVGRDHAGPGKDSAGKPFYGPYDAQELVRKFEKEIGIGLVTSKEVAYVEELEQYLPADELKEGQTHKTISGTQFRAMLRAGEPIPEWFSFPEVVEELRRAMRKEQSRGAAVFFTGYSGAGKSTIAHVLYHKLLESSERSVTLLDGDVVRTHLSKGLGFSREDRDANIERIGFVAGEIAKAGGVALCAAIAPYAGARERARKMVEKNGTFIEVFIDTPLAECEARDPKGLYKKAHEGKLKNFTGVDDPYEPPAHPELVIDTLTTSPEAAADLIFSQLAGRISGVA